MKADLSNLQAINLKYAPDGTLDDTSKHCWVLSSLQSQQGYLTCQQSTKKNLKTLFIIINDVLCVEKRRRLFDERAATAAAGKHFETHLT